MRTLPVLVVLVLAVAVAGLAPSSSPATADEGQPAAQATGTGGVLETSIVVEKLAVPRGASGHEGGRWVPAQRLSAGDEVHYTVRVRNPGESAVTDVVVTKRLPFGVRYELGSATGPGCEIQLSADGGRSFTRPEATRGKKGQRKAAEVEYTHVRWVMSRPLAPGATALLRFRATFS
ncbi:MAG TPA: hypothetical protein VNS57_12575 [Steroidobacteraceae bacterium]|nr:hypothetical protein [Steroidobacteraceae bacterium]